MKTIAPAAMAAIVARKAIVTGAAEIIPQPTIALDPAGPDVPVELTWWQVSLDQTGEGATTNDQARMGMQCFDGSGTALGAPTWATLDNNIGPWVQRTLSDSIPANTATLRLLQHRHRNFGPINIDGYIDDIALTLNGSPIAVVNPGSELGTAGWTDQGGTLVSKTGIPPHSGSYYFSGSGASGSPDDSIAYQDIGPLTLGTIDTVDPAPTIRVWGGPGVLTLDGNDYLPLGDRGFAQQTAGALGGVAQGMTLTLSGVEAAALALLDPAEVRNATVVMRRLIFGSDGKTLLDHSVWDRGRCDGVQPEEVIGGAAAIIMSVESAARGLGRGGGRMRSDSDQKLINPRDGYFKATSYAGEKTFYWGGKKPARSGTATIGSGL